MRALVMGATGMLGHVVAAQLAREHEVHSGVRDVQRARRHAVAGELHAVDASSPAAAAELVARTAPEIVVNAIGLVKQLDEASRPIPAITMNALLPHVLAAAALEHGARLIHVSTDCVFSGRLPAPRTYREDDPPDAEDLYGRTKLLGEVHESPGLTLRTSIIGRELGRASGLMEWFVRQQGATLNGFAHAIFSGVTTKALARVIEQLITGEPELAGLYQVAAEPIAKYDLLVRMREALDVDCEIVAVDEPHLNRALDGSRFAAETRIEVPSWDDMLDEYREDR
jgi:dTDP-4-dehydrorhamnose reductase